MSRSEGTHAAQTSRAITLTWCLVRDNLHAKVTAATHFMYNGRVSTNTTKKNEKTQRTEITGAGTTAVNTVHITYKSAAVC